MSSDPTTAQGASSPEDAPASMSARLREFVDEAPLERRSIVEFVMAAAASLPDGARVADVGAGGSPYRELFGHCDYVAIDRAQTLHAEEEQLDVVGSADALPCEDESFDAVLCTQVLEHLPEPAAALAEMCRVLRPGGQLFLTAPLAWEEHEMPHDYFRYTSSGLDHLARSAGFGHLSITPRTDCFTTLAQMLLSARWSLGEANDVSQLPHDRLAAFRRLEQLADELVALAPLDARRSLTLGYTLTATRVRPSAGPRAEAAGAAAVVAGRRPDERIPLLYLAPWVDLGGSDKGTIDLFKHLDRSRWAPSIITTQPSPNRWLMEIEPYAEEIWALPELMPGHDFPGFVLDFIESRGVRVVHVMNSRLGFDLMPDMTCLNERPATVVQLHAEEPDRSGYVRYSASRYGNLVDAFSVTSRQLADAMLDYEVPRSRMHVITTGVDGREEFDPGKVEPFADLDGDGPRILWPGRLVAQKDPHLTLDVVKILHDRGVAFVIDIVGDGEMEAELRERARALGVEGRIRWYPPSHEMPRWYRTDDVLLMTSVFEGVPYVMYEAQAMGMPIVVPAIPGNVEFLSGEEGGVLIDPRDDAVAYADALQRLLEDPAERRRIGAAARERMLRDASLETMARRHEELYERLLGDRLATDAKPGSRSARPPVEPPPRVRFPRATPPERSVAVIVPCYQHGRFLPEAIASLHAQTLRPSRIVVVDDASGDPETTEALDRLDRDPLVTVLRLPVNSGPSVARNRALALVRESYVLPLDADDLLLPRALEDMVEQLEAAPDDVGFIYPNALHFGNRHDYYEAPAYNLHLLLDDNYCAATSLFDRRVFDAGIAYPEDIVFGHEDWDLVLTMAEHGVHGESAEGPTFLYRKRGFSRVNAVEYGPGEFKRWIERRHPVLYERREQIKARWAPALSVLLLDGPGSWPDDVVERLTRQTFRDVEVLRVGDAPDGREEGVAMVPGAGAAGAAEAVRRARGRFVLALAPEAASALARPALCEQVTRVFWSNSGVPCLALARPEGRRRAPLTLLDDEAVATARLAGVAWRRHPEMETTPVAVDPEAEPLEALLQAVETTEDVQWRAT